MPGSPWCTTARPPCRAVLCASELAVPGSAQLAAAVSRAARPPRDAGRAPRVAWPGWLRGGRVLFAGGGGKEGSCTPQALAACLNAGEWTSVGPGSGKYSPGAERQGRHVRYRRERIREVREPVLRACIGRTRARRAIRRLTARGGRPGAGQPAAASHRLSTPLGTPARPGWRPVRRSSPDPGSSAHRSPACSRRTSALACRETQSCLVWKRSHTRRLRWRRRRALRGGVLGAPHAPPYAAAHNAAVRPYHPQHDQAPGAL